MLYCPICNKQYTPAYNNDPTYTIYKCENCGDFFFLEAFYNYDTFKIESIDSISLKEKVSNYEVDNYTLFVVGNTRQLIEFEKSKFKNHFLAKGYKTIITILA